MHEPQRVRDAFPETNLRLQEVDSEITSNLIHSKDLPAMGGSIREQEVIPCVQCGISLRSALVSFFHLLDIMVIVVVLVRP